MQTAQGLAAGQDISATAVDSNGKEEALNNAAVLHDSATLMDMTENEQTQLTREEDEGARPANSAVSTTYGCLLAEISRSGDYALKVYGTFERPLFLLSSLERFLELENLRQWFL